MAIDKESTGIPQVDLHRKTTKVNLSVIVAIGLFYVIGFGVLIYFARRSESSNKPSPTIHQDEPAAKAEQRPQPPPPNQPATQPGH